MGRHRMKTRCAVVRQCSEVGVGGGGEAGAVGEWSCFDSTEYFIVVLGLNNNHTLLIKTPKLEGGIRRGRCALGGLTR